MGAPVRRVHRQHGGHRNARGSSERHGSGCPLKVDPRQCAGPATLSTRRSGGRESVNRSTDCSRPACKNSTRVTLLSEPSTARTWLRAKSSSLEVDHRYLDLRVQASDLVQAALASSRQQALVVSVHQLGQPLGRDAGDETAFLGVRHQRGCPAGEAAVS